MRTHQFLLLMTVGIGLGTRLLLPKLIPGSGIGLPMTGGPEPSGNMVGAGPP